MTLCDFKIFLLLLKVEAKGEKSKARSRGNYHTPFCKICDFIVEGDEILRIYRIIGFSLRLEREEKDQNIDRGVTIERLSAKFVIPSLKG